MSDKFAETKPRSATKGETTPLVTQLRSKWSALNLFREDSSSSATPIHLQDLPKTKAPLVIAHSQYELQPKKRGPSLPSHLSGKRETKAGNYADKLLNAYKNVLSCINSMDEKLVGNLKSSQDTILTAYRLRFNELHNELQHLKNQLSDEQIALRRDREIVSIEEERDWYCDELKKCQERLKARDESFKKLQADYEEAVADKNLLYGKYMSVKKENKFLYQKSLSPQKELATMLLKPCSEPACRLSSPGSDPRPRQRLSQISSPEPSCSLKKNEDIISSLKRQLAAERSKVKKLVAEKVSEESHNTELKEFFERCIKEVKKDIMCRSGVRSSSQSAADVSSPPSEDDKLVPGLSAFTSTDRRKTIEMLMANEEFVEKVTEEMFPKKLKTVKYRPTKELMKAVGSKRLDSFSPSPKRLAGRKTNYIEYRPYAMK